MLYEYARGIDKRPWQPRPKRKSVSAQAGWGVRFKEDSEVNQFANIPVYPARNREGGCWPCRFGVLTLCELKITAQTAWSNALVDHLRFRAG